MNNIEECEYGRALPNGVCVCDSAGFESASAGLWRRCSENGLFQISRLVLGRTGVARPEEAVWTCLVT